MNKSIKLKITSYVIAAIIGVICYLIWKYAGLALSKEISPDYSILPHPTNNTIREILIYFLISFLLTCSFYFPIINSGIYANAKIRNGFLISVLFLSVTMSYVSSNAKGMLLSNWFGEDYGFTINLIKTFFLAPILFYFLNRLVVVKLPVRSLVYLFLSSFAIYYISKFSTNSNLRGLDSIRAILLNGYFIIFYSIALTFVSVNALKEESI